MKEPRGPAVVAIVVLLAVGFALIVAATAMVDRTPYYVGCALFALLVLVAVYETYRSDRSALDCSCRIKPGGDVDDPWMHAKGCPVRDAHDVFLAERNRMMADRPEGFGESPPFAPFRG